MGKEMRIFNNVRQIFLGVSLLYFCLTGGCASPKSVPRLQTTAGENYHKIPIGVGEDYSKESRTLTSVRRDLEVLRTNGISLMRISFPWEAIEPERGRYDWTFWDELVKTATQQYGIRLIPYVCYTPRWAAGDQGPDFWRQPPKDNADFAEFMREIVSRYRDRIRSWEIWNEPDNPDYWLGSVEQFSELLRVGSAAVHEANPSAKVVMGGLAWNLNFLQAMLTNPPAIRNVDVFNLHNYYETWSAEPQEKISDYVCRAHDLILSHGHRQPLWTAEVGYSNFRPATDVFSPSRAFYDYEHTSQYQASSLFRALTLLLASGKISLITWYRINDLPQTQEVIGDANNRYLGLISENGQAKPALRALNYFQSLFTNGFRCIDADLQVIKQLNSAAQVHAFARPDGSIVVIAWLKTVVPGERDQNVSGAAPDKREEKVDLLLPYAKATAAVFDEEGRHRGATSVRQDRHHAYLPGVILAGGTAQVFVIKPS